MQLFSHASPFSMRPFCYPFAVFHVVSPQVGGGAALRVLAPHHQQRGGGVLRRQPKGAPDNSGGA